jgi:hypothetical protein
MTLRNSMLRIDISRTIQDANVVTHEDLEDAVDDLAHDLGKYIHLPITLLPTDVDDVTFREAAHKALHQTRRGPNGSQSAASLWAAFQEEAGNELSMLEGWSELAGAVAQALTWTEAVSDTTQELNREALLTDLRAVTPAIRKLRVYLND